MNQFLTFPGQQPIWLDDIDYMNKSVRETLLFLIQSLMGPVPPFCILYGVEFLNYSLTPGAVVINGEIMPCQGIKNTQSYGTTLYGFNVVETKSGRREFKDGAFHDCYVSREAVPVLTSGTHVQYPTDAIAFHHIGTLWADVLKPTVITLEEVGAGCSSTLQIFKQGGIWHCVGRGSIQVSRELKTILKQEGYIPGIFNSPKIREFPIIVTDRSRATREIIPGRCEVVATSGTHKSFEITAFSDKTYSAGSGYSFSFTFM